MRLIRITAWVLRFVAKLKHRRTGASSSNMESVSFLSNTELSGAETFWFLKAQECFSGERRLLEAEKLQDGGVLPNAQGPVCKDSTIPRLCLMLDEDGLLLVGGRLQQSGLTFEAKRPILLPKDHEVTELIIRLMHVSS